MIYGVYNSFLNSIVWIIPKTFCFLSARHLTHMLFENIALDVIHCLLYHLRNTALECYFGKIVGGFYLSVRECHHINLSVWEELVLVLAEHHGWHVTKQTILFRTSVEFHLVKNCSKRCCYHLISQLATDLDKIITKKHQ